jgi:Flp pilus assembly protein CpaB
VKRIHIDVRLVAAAVLALIAGAGVHTLTQPVATIDVLVAAEAIPPGVRLGDLALTIASAPPLPGLVPADQAEVLADHSLGTALAPGDPLLTSLLVPPPGDRPDVAALTLDPAHAVQGDLIPGDRVDIYVSADGTTELLATDVLILAAATGTGGLEGGDTALLLAVDHDLAGRLVAAVHNAEVDLVRRGR